MRLAVVATFSVVILTGCASTPSPQYVNGAYYMTGGSDCPRFRMFPGRISCEDSKGNHTGSRYPMSQSDMQYYQQQQHINAMQMQSLSNNLNQAGQSWSNAGNQILQQSNQYQAPQVAPLYNQGGNQVRCINTGIYTNCRY